MSFQVICMKNKRFWSKVVTVMSAFMSIIVAVAVVFPVN